MLPVQLRHQHAWVEHARWIETVLDGAHGFHFGDPALRDKPMCLGHADAVFGADCTAAIDDELKHLIGDRCRGVCSAKCVEVQIALGKMTEVDESRVGCQSADNGLDIGRCLREHR